MGAPDKSGILKIIYMVFFEKLGTHKRLLIERVLKQNGTEDTFEREPKRG